ncbi:MAG: hypothetical protein VCC00_05050 [Deltaproteobacteria bacterium]
MAEHAPLLPSGAVVLPAYLADTGACEALLRTLDGLPAAATTRIAVVQPGPAGMPDLAAIRSHAGLLVVEEKQGIGKWPAFAAGVARLRGDEAWVAVVDADNAFPGASVERVAARLLEAAVPHAIGTRTPEAIDLRAIDETSPHQRLHAEAFFNALTLIALGCEHDPTYRGADLQSGLHVFTPERLAALDPAALPFYGGELQFFHATLATGAAVAFAPVEVSANPLSAYRFAEIANELLALPFLAFTTEADRARALAEAATMYQHWPMDPRTFIADVHAFCPPVVP